MCPDFPAAGSVDSRRRSRAGLTLIEVIMAMLVLALAITSALAAMQRAFFELDTARNLEVAASIMQTEIEKERLMTFAQVSDATYRPTLDAAFLRNPAVAGLFTLSRSVASVADRSSSQMVQVTLTVTWHAHDGHSLSRSYLTYFCDGGLYNYIYKNA